MSWHRYVLPIMFFALVIPSAFAQTPGTLPRTSTGPTPLPGSTVPGTRKTNHHEPCWEVAGVSKSVMEQRRMLNQQTRQEVESVCANSSLTATQKQERIREIHQQERQRLDTLITPQQQEAMHACQHSRAGTHLGGGHGGHGGPCGTLASVPHKLNESDWDEEESPHKD